MTINLFQTPEYRTIMEKHIAQTIHYFYEKNQEFSIVCEVKHTLFTPELPKELKDTFKETVMFLITGYTFESSGLKDGNFRFEAGFGEENFGSEVTVPLLGISQIFIGDNPVVINHAKPVKEERVKEVDNKAEKSSMEALLNNPENKKLLKRRK